MRQSHSLSPPSALASFEESLQVATSPRCGWDLPDVISANPSRSAWAPVTAVPWSASACFFLHVIGLPPFTIEVGFPLIPVENDFTTDPFFETAAIPLCSGPPVCSPPRSFLPLRLIAAEQPRLLRPSRTCFVASACIGYANHPLRQLVVWGLAPHQIHSLVGCSVGI